MSRTASFRIHSDGRGVCASGPAPVKSIRHPTDPISRGRTRLPFRPPACRPVVRAVQEPRYIFAAFKRVTIRRERAAATGGRLAVWLCRANQSIRADLIEKLPLQLVFSACRRVWSLSVHWPSWERPTRHVIRCQLHSLPVTTPFVARARARCACASPLMATS